MADIVDRASDVEEQFRERSIARQMERSPRGASAHWCQNVYCGVEIPQRRRAAIPGVQYCIDCQIRIEKQQRGHG